MNCKMENDITNDPMCPCEDLTALLHSFSELQLHKRGRNLVEIKSKLNYTQIQ